MAIKLTLLAKEIFKSAKLVLKNLIGTDISISHKEGPKGLPEALSSVLWSDAFVTQIKIDNIADNDFWLIIEKKGAIFLSGKLLVLPQKTLEENLEKGELNESMLDAQREICNMLVGAIDDVFREKIDSSLHLSMGDTFLYNVNAFLSEQEEYITYIAEVKIGDFEFNMTIIIAHDLTAKIEAYLQGETLSKEEEKTQPTEEQEAEETPPEKKSEVIQLTLPKEAKELTAETIAERDFPAIHAEATLAEALKKMNENNSDHLFVVDGLKLLGIITMTDVKAGLSPFLEEPFREYCRPLDEATQQFKVAWFMKTEVPSVSPDATILEVTQVLAENPISFLPVCYNGRIIGYIPLSKLLLILAKLAFGKETSEENEFTAQAAVA